MDNWMVGAVSPVWYNVEQDPMQGNLREAL